jgi:hypothetical protein
MLSSALATRLALGRRDALVALADAAGNRLRGEFGFATDVRPGIGPLLVCHVVAPVAV